MPDYRMEPRRSPKYERAQEEEFKRTREAWELLDLIDAEFRSDPKSTQCFDSRIVDRVKYAVALHKKFEAEYGFF